MKFAIKPFVKTILIFLVLSAIWTYFSVLTDRFSENGKGFLTGLGYLLIFAASFHFGRNLLDWDKWVLLNIWVIGIFCVASFVLYWLTALNVILYFVVNSVFVAWALTHALKKFYGMENRRRVMIATGICALLGYGVIFGVKEYAPYSMPVYLDRIHGMFNIFQLALVIPLAAGLSVTTKKEAPDQLPEAGTEPSER